MSAFLTTLFEIGVVLLIFSLGVFFIALLAAVLKGSRR
jgi:hypothetical protein